MRPRTRNALVAAAAALAIAVVVAAVIAFLWPMDPAPYLAHRHSPVVADRHGTPLHAFLNDDDHWCFPVPLEAISPHLIHATLAAEDQRFYQHPGVDPIAIARAAWQNLTEQRVVSGASTITMQLLKRGDLDSRTLGGKIMQLVQAPRLDRSVDKDTLLEAYLNGLPYGMNLSGAEAAARRYFGKSAAELTAAESALLAAIPKAPSALMPLDHPERARARRDFVLQRMAEHAYLTDAELHDALAAPLGVAWHDYPRAAPHVAMRYRGEARQSDTPLVLTLDAAMQTRVERAVHHAMPRLRPEVGNAAAIVVHVPTAEVRAWVGSADFFHTPGGGQVDAVRARRSPGSTLKPLIYALALDQSALYPSEVLLDAPWQEGMYNPENFDRDYRGRIAASDALRLSLNIPALTVLDRIGIPTFAALANQSGLNLFSKPPESYGLGVALGSCEATLLELAESYRVLAALGEYRTLRVLSGDPADDSADDPAGESTRLLERGACLAIFNMLEQPLPSAWDNRVGVTLDTAHRRVAWKTGTSPGNRDAWAFAFDAEYIVGVWMGNNSGRPSPRLIGSQVSLPLVASIVRALPAPSPDAWPTPGDDLRAVTICAATGLPSTEWSPATRTAMFPANAILHRRCDVFGPDGNGGTQARWPSGPRSWDLARVESRPARMAAAKEQSRLAITEPPQGAQFVLVRQPGADRLHLRATLTNSQPLHWFLNGRHAGHAKPGESIPIDLALGDHEVSCIAPDGAQATVRFRVLHPAELSSAGSHSNGQAG